MNWPGKPQADEKSRPTRASLRRVLIAVLRTDACLEAFCLDHFPAVQAEFTAGLLRSAKLNLLLSCVPTEEILTQLRESYAADTARHEHLIVLGTGLDPLPSALLNAREQRNRQRMIEKVGTFWIEGVLEKSLHEQVMIELGMEYRPDAVVYPWDMVLDRLDSAPKPIPKGKTMLDLFDENFGELLILGDPGSGKTTMLLELCRSLLKRAAADETQPIPVVLHLSSWAPQCLPIDKWLTEELFRRYSVPRQLSQDWLASRQLIFLLDGLDEVRAGRQKDCIQTINKWREVADFGGLAICSRTTDYQNLQAPLKLFCAIKLQPLTEEQIQSWVVTSGLSSHNISTWFHGEERAVNLLTSPLLLDIFSKVIRNMKDFELTDGSPESNIKKLFSAYCRTVLRRRREQNRLSSTTAIRTLARLAQRLQANSQEIFFLEDLQPIGLKSKWKFILYNFVSSFLLSFIISTISTITAIPLWIRIGNDMRFHKPTWAASINLIIFGSLLIAAFDCWRPMKSIAPIDSLRWSWENLRKGFRGYFRTKIRGSLGAGLIATIAIIYWLTKKNQEFQSHPILSVVTWIVIFWPIISIILYVLFVILGFPAAVWRHGVVADKIPHRKKPNQGILNSLYMVSILLMITTLGQWSELFIPVNVLAGPGAWYDFIPFLFLLINLLIPLLGGRAVAQHFTFRLYLALKKELPLQLVRFLDCHIKLAILYRIGSGYTFIHRLLMEYFAKLTDEEIKQLANEPSVRV